jgi:sortase A
VSAAAGSPPSRPPLAIRRTPLARVSRVFAVAMIVVGALALLDGVVTLVWQEPLTALYATFKQDSLRGDLKVMEQRAPTAAVAHQLGTIPDERQRIAYLARDFQLHAKPGSPVGRIEIPKVGADYVVVDGTGTSELEEGPGVIRETHFPGVPGTTAIAGHRTTYLAPFRHIDALRTGDRIEVDMPYAHFIYTVAGHRVVSPTDVRAAVSDVGHTRLVLSACTPLFSAAKRLLVFARLRRIVPVGASRLMLGGAIAQPLGKPLSGQSVRQKPLKGVFKAFQSDGAPTLG